MNRESDNYEENWKIRDAEDELDFILHGRLRWEVLTELINTLQVIVFRENLSCGGENVFLGYENVKCVNSYILYKSVKKN